MHMLLVLNQDLSWILCFLILSCLFFMQLTRSDQTLNTILSYSIVKKTLILSILFTFRSSIFWFDLLEQIFGVVLSHDWSFVRLGSHLRALFFLHSDLLFDNLNALVFLVETLKFNVTKFDYLYWWLSDRLYLSRIRLGLCMVFLETLFDVSINMIILATVQIF